ncbi:MAG: HypC/HybG/HupF family hydrogenase formation chaperone [Candidatus Heimdallarchaeota archaeon]|nr:HypC/HybG/HupF family hydrogenase formation chaperone [Candidatus Heimdallarchaeota archaeon]
MCLSVVAKIIEILDQNKALVDINGVKKTITISLMADDLHINEWVLVHTGFAIAKVDEEKAREILASYEQIGGVPGQ